MLINCDMPHKHITYKEKYGHAPQCVTGHIYQLFAVGCRLSAGGAGGDQPAPVSVVVCGGLNMASLVSQDALGGGQGHRIFVDDGVVGAGFAVLGDIEQGVDGLGGDHHPVGGAPQPGERIQLVIGQSREGLRRRGGLAVQHIEHPAAELLASAVRENMAIRWAPRREKIRTSFSLLPLPNPLTVNLTVKVMQGVNSSALRR